MRNISVILTLIDTSSLFCISFTLWESKVILSASWPSLKIKCLNIAVIIRKKYIQNIGLTWSPGTQKLSN